MVCLHSGDVQSACRELCCTVVVWTTLAYAFVRLPAVQKSEVPINKELKWNRVLRTMKSVTSALSVLFMLFFFFIYIYISLNFFLRLCSSRLTLLMLPCLFQSTCQPIGIWQKRVSSASSNTQSGFRRSASAMGENPSPPIQTQRCTQTDTCAS